MPIPAKVQALKALNRREHYEGDLPLTQLPRLGPVLAETAGGLHVTLDAGRDGEGAAWLRGAVTGQLSLTCQRGLHPFGWRCDVPVELRLVFDEGEEAQLAKDHEPYLVQDDRLPLRDMVEDEVLLALPMMPRCDDPNCIKRLK